MKAKDWKRLTAIVLAAAALILLGYAAMRFAANSGRPSGGSFPGGPDGEENAAGTDSRPRSHTGEIFLYGEEHAVEEILEKEFELWSACYREDGMRDLFVELPYYTAEYMNLWMQSDDDAVLDALYQDWAGTAMCAPEVIRFYQRIKSECPETVFHGTDVGHQYDTTGQRFLEYLEAAGLQQSEQHVLARKNIRQGQYYYQHSDDAYRENIMAQNFMREFDSLNGAAVMGIYGSAHTNIEAMDYATNSVPCMANQLYQKYGDALHTEDLSVLAPGREPSRTDVIVIGEKEYSALYFGRVDLSAFFPEYQYREFWRLENAYEDFKNHPTTGNVLPYNNYPMKIETGQIFVIDYTRTDGSVERKYYRSDGHIWQNLPTTEEFILEE